MAITYVGTSGYTETDADASGGNATSTFAHNVGTGTDRLLVVAISTEENNQFASGVTYNGVAMTLSLATFSGFPNNAVQLWHLANPSSGSNNVVATWDHNGTGDTCRIQALSFDGCHQTDIVDATDTDFDTDGDEDITHSFTTLADNVVIVGVVSHDQSDAGTPTSSWVEVYDDAINSYRAYVGYRIVSGAAGSYTIGWTIPGVSSALDSYFAMASYNPAGAAPSGGIRSMRQLVGHGQGTRD